MDDGYKAFELERQVRALLLQHEWDLDELHREVVVHHLTDALMHNDLPAYRRWHAVYSFAVRLAATDDPIVVFRWLAEHPDLPVPEEST